MGLRNLFECQDVASGPVSDFAVAHHYRHQQIRIIEGRAESMGNAVAQFAAFMDGSRCFGCAVATDTARKGEFLEELQHAFFVFALVGVNLRVSAFEINRAQHARCAVARASHKDGVKVVLLDEPVQVNVGEAQPGARAPMSQQPVLDVLWL